MKYRILVILALIAATVGYSLYQKKNLESQLVVDNNTAEAVLSKLPASVFETLEGAPFDVDALYAQGAGRSTDGAFLGTWCAPCEAELPELLSLIRRYEGKENVKFLLVAANDEVTKIKKHLKTLAIPEKSSIYWLIDNRNVHREAYGTTRVPETYVFSSDKRTLRKFTGPQEWNKPMFFQTFDELLQISTQKL